MYKRLACLAALCLVISFGFGGSLLAQTEPMPTPSENNFKRTLGLQEAIDLAYESNLTIKRQENTVALSEWAKWQTRANFLPTASASAGYSTNVGQVFNNVTFTSSQGQASFSSPNFNASLNIFDGLGRYNSWKQSQADLTGAQLGLLRTKNSILTQVLTAYLQVVIDKSNIDITNQRIALLKVQETRQQQLYDGGRAVEADVLNITSQIAVEELNLIRAVNTLERDKLSLLQLVIPASQWGNTEFDFETIDTSFVSIDYSVLDVPSMLEVEQIALQNLPDLQEQDELVKSAGYGLKVAKSAYYPTLSLFYSYGSQYTSSGGRRVTTFTPSEEAITIFDGGGATLVDGFVSSFSSTTITSRTGYFEQLKDNKNYTYGLSLNLTILGGGRTRQAVQNAKITLDNARLTQESTRNTLATNVRLAYLDMIAARQRIQSLDLQLTSSKRAFDNADARFTNGLINYTDYFTALNNRSRLESEQVQSRYEFFFRKKVIDFYLGRELRFDN